MYFLPLIIWIIIVYVIIRNIPLRFIWIILISALIAFFQWFVMIFYENIIFDWMATLPKWLKPLLSFIYLFMPIALAIVIRKYFVYQKNKRTGFSNKSSEQTKA